YGQFIGHKTDHDPRQRATSIGPYTSREMCRALIREVERLEIPVREKRNAVALLTVPEGDEKRAAGAVVVDDGGKMEVYEAENIIFAVGGPGGLYETSVYPKVHSGAIGVALLAGAKARSLPESQYGMASIKFRWNVSGTFMQVIPRFISTDADGESNPREFLRDHFDTVGDMNSQVFLKGYQWPFDPRKVVEGSSIVDILVYIETVINGRRVFLDFRSNPDEFDFGTLSDEARQYLENSGARQDTPIARLQHMNPGAVELYAENDIDITTEPLEIAVCAQHNNGGLAATHWWESENIRHLFPVGEVNGSHGVYRPGGSALNSGQVGAFRAAELIANRYSNRSLSDADFKAAAAATVAALKSWADRCSSSNLPEKDERRKLQSRMTQAGAHIRSRETLNNAVAEAREQWDRIEAQGCRIGESGQLSEAFKTRYLCFAHAVYLEAVRFAVESGMGSRGSAIVLAADGEEIRDGLGEEWRIVPECTEFRDQVLETVASSDRETSNRWVGRRPIPETNAWFETAWADFRSGKIFDQ
ncbi:MAG: FAD-binding protein, partial [Lentisphaerae bacterium]|nr:FAD-binding protein [Lentisphaerota bacterium]